MKKRLIFASIITAVFTIAQLLLFSIHEPSISESGQVFSMIATPLAVLLFSATFPYHPFLIILIVLSAVFSYYVPVFGGNQGFIVLAISISAFFLNSKSSQKVLGVLAFFCALLLICLPLFQLTSFPSDLPSIFAYSGSINDALFSSTIPIFEASFIIVATLVLAFYPKIFPGFLVLSVIPYFTFFFTERYSSVSASPILLLPFLFVFWIANSQKQSKWHFAKIVSRVELVKLLQSKSLIPLICLIPIFLTLPHTIYDIIQDIRYEYSNYETVANYLDTLPDDIKVLSAYSATEEEKNTFLSENENYYIIGIPNKCSKEVSGVSYNGDEENWELIESFPAGIANDDHKLYLFLRAQK